MGQEDETLEVAENDAIFHLERYRDNLPPGVVIGDYTNLGLIAKGGCGSVYHAEHRIDGSHVALKILHATLASQPKMVARFVREVKVVDLLRHPNIVSIHEIGVLPSGRPFFAMEYLEGQTLDALVRAEGRISPEEALEILTPVCSALKAAHAAGIVHRDVKGSNIMISRAEPCAVKLLDFGIAKLLEPNPEYPSLSSAGRQLGTPTIMAPEQLRGGPIDARVDVYALGVLLYRLLTGMPPFDARSPGELARQHLEEPAPRPSQRLPLPPALDAIVLRCLEKDPTRRFGSVTSFLGALRAALRDGERVSAPPVTTMGVAIYVEIQIRSTDGELDESLAVDLGCALDLTEDLLRREEFLLASATGSEILGVRPFSSDPAEISRARDEAIAVAEALRGELSLRPTADDRLSASIRVHTGEILVRPSEPPEIIGGPLLHTSAWGYQSETC